MEKPCIISKGLNENRRRRYILQLLYIIQIFQDSKIRQKFKNSPSVKKKAQTVFLISYRRALYNFKTIE